MYGSAIASCECGCRVLSGCSSENLSSSKFSRSCIHFWEQISVSPDVYYPPCIYKLIVVMLLQRNLTYLCSAYVLNIVFEGVAVAFSGILDLKRRQYYIDIKMVIQLRGGSLNKTSQCIEQV